MAQVTDAQGVRVFEKVLPDADAERLLSWTETVEYRGVHGGKWRSVWRLGDGEPLRGPTWTISEDAGTREGAPPPALRPLADALRRLVLAGHRDCNLSLTPWIYPQGTALGLHRDDRAFDGSYVFFLTREWDVHWGGLLHCLADSPTETTPPRAVLDVTAERRSVSATGRGLWIAPVWNRLVFIAPWVRHFISRVDANAGDRVRVTIAGFLHKQPRGE
jgi:hypothetical protein